MSDPLAQLALCKWLRDRIREWEASAKAELQMLPGERKAAVINGHNLGYVTLANGRKSVSVDDETAFLAWIEARWPSEVEKTVRPAFRKKMLDLALKRGALIDGDGVVCEAVSVRQGDPYPLPQLSDDADIYISDLLNRGRIGVHGLREIEAVD